LLHRDGQLAKSSAFVHVEKEPHPKDFARSLVQHAVASIPSQISVGLDPQSQVFAKCAIIFSYVRSHLIDLPRWGVFCADMQELLQSGYDEFDAEQPEACLAAAERLGSSSGAVMFDTAHCAFSGDCEVPRKAASLSGAIVNILDDILDWDEDLRHGLNTFVTTSETIQTGQELGYHRCCELIEELSALVPRRDMRRLRGLFGSWWLRNAIKNGNTRRGDISLLVRGS
jgi:hypothetical protein